MIKKKKNCFVRKKLNRERVPFLTKKTYRFSTDNMQYSAHVIHPGRDCGNLRASKPQ